MIFTPINVSSELENSENTESNLLSQVLSVFETEKKKDSKLLARLQTKQKAVNDTQLNLESNDLKMVYSIENIEKICIKYRLLLIDRCFKIG